MRSSAAKQLRNHSVKSRLHTLERKFTDVLDEGKKEDALTAMRSLCSALDKAAKTGVVNRAMANRKKSRLALRLNTAGKSVTPASAATPASKA
jgi:small subunit ribosomal protein S20